MIFYKFHLTAMMVQKSHIKETGLYESTSCSGEKIRLYNSGNGTKLI